MYGPMKKSISTITIRGEVTGAKVERKWKWVREYAVYSPTPSSIKRIERLMTSGKITELRRGNIVTKVATF